MIKGSCFTLRHARKEEVSTLIDLINHPDSLGDYLPVEIFLPGVAEKRFADEALSSDVSETFLIVDDGGRILGRVCHFKTVPYYNSRAIGYGMFAVDMRGKGIMGEAVQLLVDYLFKTMLINRLEIHMHVDHLASEKIALRCGFLKEGVARGASFSRGQHVDIAMYALLRDEWAALQMSV
jgi:[ribosomal protein S5]-alanine N-acetyltransferase